MDGNTSKHRWFTNKGSFWSAGAGLADTTVRTPGSLSLAIKPENNVEGAQLVRKIPQNPTSNVFVFGYLYRNASFSSGDLTVDLFLETTDLDDTPDATVTMPTTTDEWMLWSLDVYNAATDSRYAKFRITAKSSTPGAYCFLDDLYDAGTANKVAGMDLWDEGQISQIIVASDYSAIPNTTNLLVETTLQPYFDAIPTSGEIAAAVDAILADDFAALPASVQAILSDEFAALPTSGQIATAVARFRQQ
jgi:hypothetical protein